MSATLPIAAPALPVPSRFSWEAVSGYVYLVPFLLVFLGLVLYPVVYGFSLGLHLATYRDLITDPVFVKTVYNTLIFVVIGVNIKMVIALYLSGFFLNKQRWIRWLSSIFILAWAIPSISTILSFRWMLNPEWGIINALLFKWFNIMGPNWLTERWLAFGSAIVVHIWKSLPFWTLVLLSGRMAIGAELYEAADVDGATPWQKFRYITFPSIRTLYLSLTALSMIWSLGDFNSVYLLTGGGPADSTQVLATLGVRYLRMDRIDLSIASVIVALPLMLPLMFFMMKYLSGEQKR
ncbi:sugar ABC transporter permease [Polaromonas hydrogenivorans]|uniref:Sugar ABC transporter permease n=1 Tax=Polaromonas hydrogenivorans TaxID=335476 RepID=A0AAU7LVE2_9BURK